MKTKITSLLFFTTLLIIIGCSQHAGAQQEYSFKVKQKHILGDREGMLTIANNKVEFKAINTKGSRLWSYTDIRLFEILSPKILKVWTYEYENLLPGKSRVFTFELTEGELTDDISSYLRSRIKQPFVTSFTDNDANPITQIAVNHRLRFKAHPGTLKIYKDHLVFAAADGRNSRYWRWPDIKSIGRPDKFHLDILTYEPMTGGPDRSYNFELKEALLENAYDEIWNHVYPPSPYFKGVEVQNKPENTGVK